MNFQELVQNLVKPGKDIVDTMTPSKANMLHMAVGVSGEVAELLNSMINMDTDNTSEELGDIEFYIEGMYQELQWRPEEFLEEIATIQGDVTPVLIVLAGDLLDAVKKFVIYNKCDIDPVITALHQFVSHLNYFYIQTQIDRDEVIDSNIAKLTIRYGDKYTDAAAHQRLDKEIVA